MRLSFCLGGLFLSAAIAVTTAEHDYESLRQPTLYQSDCAKQWAKLSSDSSSGLDDRSTVTSRTGELRINLTVKLKRFTSDYVDFNTRSFNGLVPAPTIKVCPGDRLVITLTNSLGAGANNNTNLHLHGMHVPPVGDADNVMPIVEPGGQRRYTYEIRPDHPAGTFWYHPHAHGNANSQLIGMMAGTLIVADRPADFPTELAAMDDLVMILQMVCIENCFNIYDNFEDAIQNKFSSPSKHTNGKSEEQAWPTDLEIVEDDADVPLNDTSLPTVFVNGQYLPTVDIAVGEHKRLRFVNAIANNVAELVTTRDSSCTLNVLAMDGIYFDKPKAKHVIVIPPGGRADVAVMCAEIGEFYLETDCASSRNKLLGLVNQHRVPSQRIVKLKVSNEGDGSEDEDENESESSAGATRLPLTLPKRSAYMQDTIGNADDPPIIEDGNKYDFEFSVWMDKKMMYMGVNREVMNMSNINYSMPVNELQQWELSAKEYGEAASGSCASVEQAKKSSDCWTMVHPFHIHATHFQVSGMDEDTDPDGVMFALGEWRDTLPLYRSKVRIRFTPREYMVGNVMTHCHIAFHADIGMGQLVNVHDSNSQKFIAVVPKRDEESEEGDGRSDSDDGNEDADSNDEDGSDSGA